MPIDLLFIIVFGFGFRHGYTQGIITTVFNTLAYVFGIVLAFVDRRTWSQADLARRLELGTEAVRKRRLALAAR